MKTLTLRLFFAIDGFLQKRDAEKIRGFLGHVFWDNPIVHHHNPDGSLVYTYPRVQYKIIDGNCLLVAFNEGIDIVKKVFDEIQSLDIDKNWVEIHSKAIELKEENFGELEEPVEYFFTTPWLALNEENFEKYKQQDSLQKRKWLLENILTANLISIAKALGYTVQRNIHSHIATLKPINVNVKDTQFAGFYGSFSVNFDLPSLWGIGKSVARGFGTVIKKDELENYRKSVLNYFPHPSKTKNKSGYKRKMQ